MTPDRLTLAAIALILGSFGASATETGSRQLLAQAATPLTIPAPTPTTPPAGEATPAPATPPAAAAPETPPPAAGTPDQAPPAADAPDQPPPDADTTDQPPPGADAPPDGGAEDGDTPPDELSLGEIPVIETIELTPDLARRALDSYIMAKEKYADSGLEGFENLQDFVDKTDDGKKFEADIKAAGFPNVTEWNMAVTTLGVMYGSVSENQTADLEDQIKEIEGDTELAQDMKDRMIKSIKAMIPSANNKKVIEDLMADPVYGPKLQQIDIEEE